MSSTIRSYSFFLRSTYTVYTYKIRVVCVYKQMDRETTARFDGYLCGLQLCVYSVGMQYLWIKVVWDVIDDFSLL